MDWVAFVFKDFILPLKVVIFDSPKGQQKMAFFRVGA